jgi:hypothetical protein
VGELFTAILPPDQLGLSTLVFDMTAFAALVFRTCMQAFTGINPFF